MSNKIKCSHILVAKQSESLAIVERLKNGEKFGKLAKELSIDSGSGKKDGNLGYFTKGMTMLILEDPGLRLQMIGHMTENPEAMQQMMNLIDKEMIMSMKDSDQMTMMEDMMADMMERMQTDPELEQAMMKHMANMKASRDAMMGNTTDSMMTDMMDSEMMTP